MNLQSGLLSLISTFLHFFSITKIYLHFQFPKCFEIVSFECVLPRGESYTQTGAETTTGEHNTIMAVGKDGYLEMDALLSHVFPRRMPLVTTLQDLALYLCSSLHLCVFSSHTAQSCSDYYKR